MSHHSQQQIDGRRPYSCRYNELLHCSTPGPTAASLTLPQPTTIPPHHQHSDTKCKVQLPPQIPPNYKRSLSCSFPPLSSLSPVPVWLLSVGRAAQAITRKAPRTKRGLKNNTNPKHKKETKGGLLHHNYRPSSQAPALASTRGLPWFPTEKVICFYWRK